MNKHRTTHTNEKPVSLAGGAIESTSTDLVVMVGRYTVSIPWREVVRLRKQADAQRED